MFGSENCELSEGLWARTERQKLKEFSEKVTMTATPAAPATLSATAATVNTVNGAVSVGNPAFSHDSPLPTVLQQGTAIATTTARNAVGDGGDRDDAKNDERKERKGGQRGPSPPSSRRITNAASCVTPLFPPPLPPTSVIGTGAAAPSCSPTFGSGARGGITTTTTTTIGITRGRYQAGTGNNTGSTVDDASTACYSTGGAGAGAAVIAPGMNYGASSGCAASMGGQEQLEVETVGWEGALSPLCDPEITHPERVTD